MKLRLLILFFLISMAAAQAQVTWSKLPAEPYGGTVVKMVYDPSSSKTYASTMSHFYVLGGSWSLQNINDPQNRPLVDFEPAGAGKLYAITGGNPTDNGLLFASPSGGTGWAQIVQTNFFKGGVKLRVKGANEIFVLGYKASSSKYALWYSNDSGITWAVKGGDLSSSRPTDFVILSSNRILVLDQGFIKGSDDDGALYSQKTTGITDPGNITQLVANAAGTKVYCVSDSGPYESTDGGDNWTSIKGTITGTNFGQKSVLQFTADNSKIFFVDNVNHKLYSSAYPAISWSSIVSSNYLTFGSNTQIQVNCIAAKDGTTNGSSPSYFGTNTFGVFQSTNGGSVMSELNSGFTGLDFSDFEISGNGNIIVSGNDGLFVYNGTTWTKIYLGSTNASIKQVLKPLFTNTLYALGSVMYSSTDNGVTWSPDTAPPANCSYFTTPQDFPNVVFAASNSSFYVKTNPGGGWSTITVSGLPGGFQVQKILMTQQGTMFARVANGASNQLYRITFTPPIFGGTPTSGTATLVSNATLGGGFSSVDNVMYGYKTVYAFNQGTPGKLNSTGDDGNSWPNFKNIAAGGYTALVDHNFFYLFFPKSGSTTTLEFSRDNGTTSTATSAIPSNGGFLVDIETDATGVAFALVNGEGVYKTPTTLVLPGFPGMPQDVGHGATNLSFKFSSSSNATSYAIERLDPGAPQYVLIDSLHPSDVMGTDLYYFDSGLQPNKSYAYTVTGVNGAGTSQPSGTNITTLPSAFAPFIPDNHAWKLTWNSDPNNVHTDNVLVRSLGNGNYSVSDLTAGILVTLPTKPSNAPTTLGGTFFMSSNSVYISPSTIQNNGVNERHILSNGNGTYTPSDTTIALHWIPNTSLGYPGLGANDYTLHMLAQDPVPSAPANPYACSFNNNSIEVSWLATGFESQFIVQRSPSGSPGTFVQVGSAVNYPTTNFIDATVVLGTQYFYRISSSNAVGTSPFSTTASVTLAKPNFVFQPSSPVSLSVGTSAGPIWGDFDNDSLPDLIFPNTYSALVHEVDVPVAFHNDKKGGGGFTPITPNGIDVAMYLSGTAADFDNDGKLDLFLTTVGSENYLYRGNGNFSFTKVLNTPVSENSPDPSVTGGSCFSAAWTDVDKDGRLDLLVAIGGKQVSPTVTLSYKPFYFHHEADGSFLKVSSGDLATFSTQAPAMGWADYDNDGDMDLFLANSTKDTPNSFFRNDAGVMTKVTGIGFDTDINVHVQTVSWGDLNNDGRMDLFLGIQGATQNYLYQNNFGGSFTRITPGTAPQEVRSANNGTFGAAMGDINNDGLLDLLVSGSKDNTIYLGTGSFNFTKVSTEKFNDPNLGTGGVALADYDQDGFLDIANSGIDQVSPSFSKNYLYKNNNITGNWIEVQLVAKNQPSNIVIGARLKLTSSGTQIREVTSTTGFSSQNSQIVHFGMGVNTTSTLEIKWPSGLIQTITNPPINKVLVIEDETNAPVVATRFPAHNSKNASITTKIEITFDEAPYGIDGKKVSIYPHGNGVALTQIDAATATVTGKKASLTIPISLTSYTKYDVGVEAGAFSDAAGNAIPVILPATWSFTTVDNEPPTGNFTPVPSLDKGFANNTFQATADDNDSITGVVMSYRKISVANFKDLSGDRTPNTKTWNFPMTESLFDEMGIEYYFTVKDSNPLNDVRVPLDPLIYYKTIITYPEGAVALNIPAGGSKAGYQIISIPQILATPDIATNFDELSTTGDHTSVFRLVRYTTSPTEGWDEYPGKLTTIKRGEGYFINVRTATRLEITAGSAPDETQDSFFKINLKTGWNQIGNPYTVPILWSDALADNGNPTGVGKSVFYNGTSYVVDESRSISAYSGAFVHSDNDVANFKIPFKGFTSGGRIANAVTSNKLDGDEWQNSIFLSQEELRYELGAFGMARTAKLSKDDYDLNTPPRFGDYVELSFPHPEYFAKKLSWDIVPTADGHVWEFNVESNQTGEAALTWDNTVFGDNAKELYLFDVSLQRPINMREENGYTFNPKESGRFRIHYGTDLNIQPDLLMLGKAYPNPTNNATSIPMVLPESTAKYQVRLEVYDAMGQKVASLFEGELVSGFYLKEWNSNASNVGDGLYVYRMVVAGKATQSGRIIIRK